MAALTPLDGKKTAIRKKAGDTKNEAKEMMRTYVAEEEEAWDGFEFLTMAEAGELGHWEIAKTMGDTLGDEAVTRLAGWAVGVQRKHVEAVRSTCLELAAAEVSG